MYSWSVILVGVVQQIYASSETHYECGAHGKFEYCIDKEPGCVVGCHCHPGYYFDTDTKVCEPNLKLTQFRRQFDLEPTRVSMMNYEPVSAPTLTTTLNPVDAKVEAIAKDSDDLGDWLYNQFFKTIENQVINNTESEPKTRRSGDGPPPKPKRRSRKKTKKSKKKKNSKKNLKSKLLRITEDDSLFDSSSSSSSDETDSSTSSESSSDSSDDHDHRKIVMINKKPSPPLPSFIFLPNVETPFYPPIGLPAPPVVPMYPMIPVPPMGVGILQPESTTTTTSETSTTAASTTTSTSETPNAPTEETTTPAAPDVTPEETPPPALRMGARFNHPNKKMGPPNKHGKKMMREKMKNRKKEAHLRSLMEGPADFEPPPFNMPPDMHFDKSTELHQPRADEEPKMEDVDFKYLSQLIHKMDMNNPEHPINPMPNFTDKFSPLVRRNNYQNVSPIYPNVLTNNAIRRSFEPPQHKHRPVSKADDVNDAYFTNLGKQIASLIRKHEPNIDREINIEVQQQNYPYNMQTPSLLNESGFAPGRSYWERFVRSPLKTLLPNYKRYIHEMQSSENLISIENQVNVATAMKRQLSLNELENIANLLQQARFNEKKIKYQTTERNAGSNFQYKFNLLPQVNRRANLPVANGEMNVLKQEKTATMQGRYNNNFVRRLPSIVAPQTQKRNVTLTPKNQTRLDGINLAKPFRTPLHHSVSRIVHRNITYTKPPSTNQFMKHQVNPLLFSYRTVNYVNNNHNLNNYHVQRSFLPYHLPIYKPTSLKTSYFRHELHHFDFFDK